MGWYAFARWKGSGLVGIACGLSSNPTACVLGIRTRVEALGGPYVLVAKLIPGAGNLAAPAAGLARFPALKFLAADAFALTAWAALYASVGWVFAGQIEAAVRWVVASGRIVVLVGGFLIGAAALWRVIKGRLHAAAHAAAES
jgi:membrane protein DedA with SNARE-associated domain